MCGSWFDQNTAIEKDTSPRMKKSSQRAEGGAVCQLCASIEIHKPEGVLEPTVGH